MKKHKKTGEMERDRLLRLAIEDDLEFQNYLEKLATYANDDGTLTYHDTHGGGRMEPRTISKVIVVVEVLDDNSRTTWITPHSDSTCQCKNPLYITDNPNDFQGCHIWLTTLSKGSTLHPRDMVKLSRVGYVRQDCWSFKDLSIAVSVSELLEYA